MIVRLVRRQSELPWVGVFAAQSFLFLLGSVAFVINPLAGLAVWGYSAGALVHRARTARGQRATRAAALRTQQQWDDRWNRWGGRLAD